MGVSRKLVEKQMAFWKDEWTLRRQTREVTVRDKVCLEVGLASFLQEGIRGVLAARL